MWDKLPEPVNNDFFESIDTEEKAYWLGFIAADGHVKKSRDLSIELSITDEEHLLKFASIFNKRLTYRSRFLKKTQKEYSMCCLRVVSDRLNSSLKTHGMTNHKSKDLNGCVFNRIPEELTRHFIRGMFDGDGSIDKNRVFFYGNLDFLTSLKDVIFKQTGIDFRIMKNRTIFVLYVCSRDNCWDFKKYLYDGSGLFLKRKLDKFPTIEPKTSKYKHIQLTKGGKWRVSKQKDNKKVILKYFDKEEDAVSFAKSAGLSVDRDRSRINI